MDGGAVTAAGGWGLTACWLIRRVGGLCVGDAMRRLIFLQLFHRSSRKKRREEKVEERSVRRDDNSFYICERQRRSQRESLQDQSSEVTHFFWGGGGGQGAKMLFIHMERSSL